MIARNSVILIDQIEKEKAQGTPPLGCGRRGHRHRVRPILLTASAAILGMVPIAPTIFWGPMAYAIMGGLAVATALTLVFLPALYVAWFRIKRPDPTRARRRISDIRSRPTTTKRSRMKSFWRTHAYRPSHPEPGSALLGALIGGGASLSAAIYTQRSHDRIERVAAEVAKREAVYADFVMSASNMLLHAFTHDDFSPGRRRAAPDRAGEPDEAVCSGGRGERSGDRPQGHRRDRAEAERRTPAAGERGFVQRSGARSDSRGSA